MGLKLVKAAFAFVSAHNERARREEQRQLEPLELALLVHMGLTAVDEHASPMYYAGRDASCAALGLPDTDQARRRVMRATSALIAAGAIARATKGYRGSTTRYSLIYQGVPLVVPIREESTPPDAPLSRNGYHQTPEWVPPDAGMGTTESPPKEEEETEEEGTRAQAPESGDRAFELTPPPTPPWDAGLPEPTTAAEAARCPRHPTGTGGPCFECGQNRKAWQAANPGGRSQPREVLRFRIEGGRRICATHPHVLTAQGDCANCEIRAEDLALEIGATA